MWILGCPHVAHRILIGVCRTMKLSSQPRDWKQQYFLYNSDIEDGRNTDLLGWDWAVILTLKVHIRLQILITNFFLTESLVLLVDWRFGILLHLSPLSIWNVGTVPFLLLFLLIFYLREDNSNTSRQVTDGSYWQVHKQI